LKPSYQGQKTWTRKIKEEAIWARGESSQIWGWDESNGKKKTGYGETRGDSQLVHGINNQGAL